MRRWSHCSLRNRAPNFVTLIAAQQSLRGPSLRAQRLWPCERAEHMLCDAQPACSFPCADEYRWVTCWPQLSA